MFRNVYKEANECIKGDREVLDRAFLQAAQIEERKTPVMKLSVIGTAVTAVVVMGAVFMNSELFLEKDYNEVTFEKATEAVYENSGSDASVAFTGAMVALEDHGKVSETEVSGNVISEEYDNAEEAVVKEVENTSGNTAPEKKIEENASEKSDKAEKAVPENVPEDQNDTLSVAKNSYSDKKVEADIDVPQEIRMPEENVPSVASMDETGVRESFEAEDSMPVAYSDEDDAQPDMEDKMRTSGGSAGGGGSSSWSMRRMEEADTFSEDGEYDAEVDLTTVEEEHEELTEADIIERALEICTIDYVAYDHSFDDNTQLWNVTFIAEDGSYQSVTLDMNGILRNLTSN